MATLGELQGLAARIVQSEVDHLIEDLIDYDIAPIHLPVARGHPLEPRYQACVLAIARLLGTLQQDGLRGIAEDLDWDLRKSDDLASAVLEQSVRCRYRSFATEPRYWETSPDGAVFSTYPELREHLDGDGLIRADRLDARAATIFHSDSALHYHPFLRRHFNSHINEDLIGTLLRLSQQPGNVSRIAIDPEHHRPTAHFEEYCERDYWHGPPLNAEKLDDPHYVGVTVHGDPLTGLTHEYPRLFVSWARDGEGNKVVQIEELCEHQSARQGGLRLLRYLHAIRDTKRGVFVHCDGAVRGYTEEEYALRAQRAYVTGRQSASRYRKLFRIDGAITASEWGDLTAKWFRHNRLILEYLESLGPGDDSPRSARGLITT